MRARWLTWHCPLLGESLSNLGSKAMMDPILYWVKELISQCRSQNKRDHGYEEYIVLYCHTFKGLVSGEIHVLDIRDRVWDLINNNFTFLELLVEFEPVILVSLYHKMTIFQHLPRFIQCCYCVIISRSRAWEGSLEALANPIESLAIISLPIIEERRTSAPF